MIRIAQANADRAGVGRLVQFERRLPTPRRRDAMRRMKLAAPAGVCRVGWRDRASAESNAGVHEDVVDAPVAPQGCSA